MEEHTTNLREEKMKNMTPAEKERYKEKKIKRQKNKMARKGKAVAK